MRMVCVQNRYRQPAAPVGGPNRGTSVLKLCNLLTFVLHQCISSSAGTAAEDKEYLRRGEDGPAVNCAFLCSP